MSVSIVHTGDIHLGASRTKPECEKRLLSVFFDICAFCDTHTVDLLLIAGDLFDVPLPPSSISDAVFRRLSEMAHTKAVILPGNHDYLCVGSPYERELPENVFVLSDPQKPIDFPEYNTRVWGTGYVGAFMDTPVLPVAPKDSDRIELAVLHVDLLNGERYAPVTEAELSDTMMDYIAMGHIHKGTLPVKNRQTYYAYCGCPQGRGFDECGDKGILYGTVDKQNNTLQFVSMAKKQYLRLTEDLTDVSTFDDALERVKGLITDSQDSIRLTLTGTPDTSVSALELTMRLKALVDEIEITDAMRAPADKAALLKDLSLKGVFYRRMMRKIETASPEETESLEKALALGLRAFDEDVTYQGGETP